jgi:hypothetical protein
LGGDRKDGGKGSDKGLIKVRRDGKEGGVLKGREGKG